jgi:hypothetical protein
MTKHWSTECYSANGAAKFAKVNDKRIQQIPAEEA